MLLESILNNLLSQLDLGANPERNARILELYLGLDGKGAHTNSDIKDTIDAEYPAESITQERVRVLCNQAQKQFAKLLVVEWKKNSFFSELVDFIKSELPISEDLLAQRLADPNFECFHAPKDIKPFAAQPFKVDGLLKIFKLVPKRLLPVTIQPQLVYCGIARKKNKEIRFSARNTAPSLRFITNAAQKIDLNQLISHAERSIRFNAMIAEQSLIPLMPNKVPLYKREELAHSIVVGHSDFKWLDEKRGYFTYTTPNLLNNRISKIAYKIFQFTDAVHLVLFANLVSKAVRAPARILKGETEGQSYKDRSDLLQAISFTADTPFTPDDAKLYFVGTDLCSIDHNDMLRPTSLLLENVDANIKDSEFIMRDVLDTAPDKQLAPIEFKEQAIEQMAQTSTKEYMSTLKRMVSEKYFVKNGKALVLTHDGFRLYMSRDRDTLSDRKDALTQQRVATYEMMTSVSGMLKKYRNDFQAQLKETKAHIKLLKEQSKKTSLNLNAEIDYYEDQIANLMLLKSEFSDFNVREKELLSAIKRIEKAKQKLTKEHGNSPVGAVYIRKEDERIQIGTESLELYKKLFTSTETDHLYYDILHLTNIGQITAAMGDLLGIEVTSNNEITLLQKFVTFKLNYLDELIEALPKPNDKFEMLVMQTFQSMAAEDKSNEEWLATVELKALERQLKHDALELERQFGSSLYNQKVLFSPLFFKLANGNYTYLGAHSNEIY